MRQIYDSCLGYQALVQMKFGRWGGFGAKMVLLNCKLAALFFQKTVQMA
jgi:hypothetical protein